MTQRDLLASHARAAGMPFRPVRIPIAALRAAAALADTLERVQSLPSRRIAMAIASVNASVDCSRAHRDLDWHGEASCEDAIRRAVEWELARRAPDRAPHARRTAAQEVTT
jgi:nucleoside-diphosphate-sugar epimerase